MSALPDAARDLAEYSRARIQWLSGVRLEQHGVPVKIQELPLAAGPPSHINYLRNVDGHSLERGTVSNRRDYELSVVLEANEPAIEKMINAGRQKQAILTV